MYFLVFFLYITMFWLKMTEKARNILTFYCNSLFFSQNGINYPLFSVFKRINISSKKPCLLLVQKKEIYAITRKKFLFTEKVDFSMIFCLFHCFHKKIKEKQWILRQCNFFSQNCINYPLLSVFRRIKISSKKDNLFFS